MISAIILAAGASRRMGQQKLLMPWGKVTVIQHIVSVFADARVNDIVVVTGSQRNQIEESMLEMKRTQRVRVVFNEAHETGAMLSSVQCGLRDLTGENSRAALIGLGDQPQIEERTVRLICEAYLATGSPLVVPSYQMRRGHPWLVDRSLWSEVLDMNPLHTLRDFLTAQATKIHYIEVATPNILNDLDTPQDYQKSRP